MAINRIPSNRTKRFSVSYAGEFLGDIIRGFGLDLFSSKGKVKSGKKLYPHTVESDLTGITPPSQFVKANIRTDGDNRAVKIWAVADGKVVRSANNSTFEEDSAEELEGTDGGSDLLSIGDDTGEEILTTQLSIGDGTGAFSITGGGNTVKWAQSFQNISGPFTKLSLWFRKVGSPTDNLTISIQEDNGGEPSGTSLVSLDQDASGLLDEFDTENPNEYEATDFTPSELTFNIGKKYWLVFERDGSASSDDYVQVMLNFGGTEEDDDPYENGQLLSQNEVSNWERTITYEKVDTFTSGGNWTVPSDVTEATVECWAAGGGGTTGTGGGGGGAYSRSEVSSLTPSSSISVTVGSSSSGSDGGDSTFDTNVVVAKGGKSGSNGGQGGQSSAGTGDVKFSGGDGSTGTGNRGGGGGAGDSSAGGNANGEEQGGGGSEQGGYGGGLLFYPDHVQEGGNLYGGGGNSTDSIGRSGARGEVRVTYKVAVPEGFPVVSGRAFSREFFAGGARPVPIPEGTMPGDLLIVAASIDEDEHDNVSVSGGWTKLVSEVSVFDHITQAVFYKFSQGGDEGEMSFSGTQGFTMITYRIPNGGTPTATVGGSETGAVDPPDHSTGTNDKYLWIAVASNRANGVDEGPTAPPSNYSSFIIQPEQWTLNGGDSSQEARGARTSVAERLLEALSENPGPFTGGGSGGSLGSTIAIPLQDDTQYYDASMSIQVEFPESPERLYVTSKKDVMFLDREDESWHSLWRGTLRQDDLNENYPRVLKNLGAGGTLMLGNDNHVHTMVATANDPSEVNENRLTFDPTHFVSWIAVTSTAAFIGLTDKRGDLLTSIIAQYEPFAERVRIFRIREGATVGFVMDDNCHIIDKTGQLRVFSGSAFQDYAYLPPYYREEKVEQLPHRNGVTAKDGFVKILWKGQYPDPAGVWVFEGGNLYHRNPLVFDKAQLNSLGSFEGEDFSAYYEEDSVFVGASVRDGSDTKVTGIYSDINPGVSEDNRGRLEASRFLSAHVNTNWQKVLVKHENGEVQLKQRRKKGEVDETTEFSGTWTASDTFTCDTTAFIEAVDNGQVKVGDEVTVRKGQASGLVAHVTEITGGEGVEKTVTLDDGLAVVSSGSFTFSVENWRKVTNKKELGKNPSDWIQLKAEVKEGAELEELQVSSEVNETLNQ